jgi:alcohol dehydrogenase
MATIETLVFEAPGVAALREVAAPTITGPGEALVRPLMVGRCDLDLAFMLGLAPMPAGAPIGHEMVGEIADLSEGVTGYEIGERVIVPAQINCGVCEPCRRGFTGRCASVPFAASYGMGRDGEYSGLASDLVRVPYAEAMLVKVPAEVSDVAAVGLADMAADAWRAVAPALAKRPGGRVLVCGGMPPVIGLYAAALAKALGGDVTYLDSDSGRRTEAAKYGIACAAHPDAVEGIFDVLVDSPLAGNSLKTCIACAAPAARLTIVTTHFETDLALDWRALYHAGIELHVGRPDCRTALAPVVSFAAKGCFDPTVLTQTVFARAQAPQAFSGDHLRGVVAWRK